MSNDWNQKWSTVTLEKRGKVAWLTLNRPEALNALNQQALSDLDQALTHLEVTSLQEVSVLVVTGSGEKAFVAGADIKEMSNFKKHEAFQFARRGQLLFQRFEKLGQAVIACVNGFALGGGLELALACDFIYASEKAKFGLPEVGLGLLPGFGGTLRLSRVVGLNHAREMILSAEMISADRALQLGLVNQVFPADQLLAQTQALAEKMSMKGPVAVQKAKLSILECFDRSVDAGLDFEANQFAHLFETEDMKEGTTAFMEKRKPQFQGR